MLGKGDVSETDIDEMLQEYYRFVKGEVASKTPCYLFLLLYK